MHTLKFDKSDWADIDPKNQNSWQRIAAHSHGFVTIGNIVTLLGLAISLIGVKEIYDNNLVLGIWLLGIGRVADIMDGYVANLTKTKSALETFFLKVL